MNHRIEQRFAQTPLQTITGIQVARRMKEMVGNTEKPLEAEFVSKREKIMADPDGQLTIDLFMGRSGVAKGSLGMARARFAERDPTFQEYLKNRGLELEIISFNFSLGMIAASKEGIIPPLQQGQWLVEHYAKGSRFISQLIHDHILNAPHPGKFIWFLYESGPVTSYPQSSNLPIQVVGTDRGNSPLYEVALMEETRKNSDIFVIRREEAVRQIVLDHRSRFNLQGRNYREIFGGDIVYVMTNGVGKQVTVSALPLVEQKRIAALLTVATATPDAIVRSDSDMDKIETQLYREGKIKSKDDDSAYFDFIRRGLKDFPIEQYHDVLNREFRGRKTYLLDHYLRYNLILKLYPGLIDYVMANVLNKD